jgi:hypothetical protein
MTSSPTLTTCYTGEVVSRTHICKSTLEAHYEVGAKEESEDIELQGPES